MDVIGGGWTLASKLHCKNQRKKKKKINSKLKNSIIDIGGWAPIGSAYMTQRGNNLWNGDQFGSVDDGMSENVGGFIYQYSNVVYSGNTGLRYSFCEHNLSFLHHGFLFVLSHCFRNI